MHKTEESNYKVTSSPDFERAVKVLLRATAGKLGESFLHALTHKLMQVFELDAVVIARWQNKTMQRLECISDYSVMPSNCEVSFDFKGSHFETILKHGFYLVNNHAVAEFSQDSLIQNIGSQAFVGCSLVDSQRNTVGFLVAYKKSPIKNTTLITTTLEVFAIRVAAELERQDIHLELKNEVRLNQTQLNSAPAFMFMLDREHKFLRWNEYFFSRLGYQPEDIHDTVFTCFVAQQDRRRIEIEIEQIFEQQQGSVYLNILSKTGDLVPLLVTADITFYENQSVFVAVALDMTEQQSVERNLLRSQGRLARKNSQLSLINNLLEKLHTSRSVFHIAQQVVKLLQSLQKDSWVVFTEYDEASENMVVIATGGVAQVFIDTRKKFSVHEQGSPIALAMQSKQLEIFQNNNAQTYIKSSLRNIFFEEGIKSGIAMPFIYQGKPLGCVAIGYKSDAIIATDEVEFFQTIGTSISLAMANARQYQSMKNLATIDTLTALPNRNALNRDCYNALNANLSSSNSLGLILVDLDRFKEINDTLDHQIGDKLLRLIGPRMAQVLNDQDGTVYRLGGDEFCILVRNKQQSSQFIKIAELVRQAIELPFVVDGLNLEISSSIGVATTIGVQHNPAELLRCAELAMYQIKSQGGGVAQYSPEMDADTNQRFVIMAEMAEAIRNNELVLHFQPKFDLKSNTIFSCEALVRWQHKQYGLLPPAKFIPLVELTQLIHPLTQWVLKNAMAQMQRWKAQGVNISVAINLSTRNLTDDDFVGQVKSLLNEYEIDPSTVEFEVTETALMSNLERAMRQLQAFNQLGIKCSLDDYGTGYSSLSYIKKLPLDILKIDRTFISKMLDYSEDRIIAQSTINLAHRLGLKVVAEGVEDQKTIEELTRQGCDLIQGYFISRPVEADELAEMYWKSKRGEAVYPLEKSPQ
ncbi:EAL domain-containing protein [Aliikangiella sp. IMCC44632]